MNLMPGWHPGGLLEDGAAAVGPIEARYVGRYTGNYGGTTTATITVPGADIQLCDGEVSGQLVWSWPAEVPVPISANIAGVNAVALLSDPIGFVFMYQAAFSGGGDAVINLVCGATSSEATAIDVWEVINAEPAYMGMGSGMSDNLNAAAMERFTVEGGIYLASVFNPTDTASYTWSGLTEVGDGDVGDFRLSSADDLTPAVAETRATVTATAGSPGRAVGVGLVPLGQEGVKGTITAFSGSSATGTSLTISPTNNSMKGLDGTNAGDFTLLAIIHNEVSNGLVTGVTFDGNAMTALGSVQNASANINISAWSIPVTSADAVGNLVATFTGSIGIGVTVGVMLARLYDVGSFCTVGTAQGNAAGAAVSPAVDINDGGLIIGVHVRATDTQVVTWSGLEEMLDRDGGSFRHSIGCRWNCAAETDRAITASGASGQYATLVLPINA